MPRLVGDLRGGRGGRPGGLARRGTRRSCSPRGELRFAPGGDLGGPARPKLERRGRPRGARARGRGRTGDEPPPIPTRSAGSGRRSSCPLRRRRARLGGAGLGVRGLGRGRPRRRRQPRVAPRRRLRGRAARAAGAGQRRRASSGRSRTCAGWFSSTSRYPPRDEWTTPRRPRSALRRATPRACAHGLRRPHNWVQLGKFCVVGGSGYIVNLRVFAICVKALGLHHLVAATRAFIVAVTNNFWWNRHWTFRAREGPRRLPGGALLRGQHRGLPVRCRPPRVARERRRRVRRCRRRRSRSSPPRR